MVPQLGICSASMVAASRSDVLTDPEGRLIRSDPKGLQIPDFRHWRAVSQERNDRKKQFSQGETVCGGNPHHKLALPLAGAAAFPGNSPDFRQKRLGQRSDIKQRGKGDLAGENRALDQAVSCLGRYGRAVIIGMCLEPVHLTEPSVMLGYMNHAVKGHDGYEPRDIAQLVRLVGSGRLDLSRSVSHIVPLEDVARGVDRRCSHGRDPATEGTAGEPTPSGS